MKPLKLMIIGLAVTAFTLSCSQSTPTPNAPKTNSNISVANIIANTIAYNVSGNTVSMRPPQASQMADVMDDETVDLYKENCMICHKDTGKAGKMTMAGKTIDPADLTSARIKSKSDEKLLSEIKEGMPEDGMPAFKGKLSDDEIKSIIQRIRKF